MRTLNTVVFFIGIFLVLIGMPEEIIGNQDVLQTAKPHEVWNSCGTWCEPTCDHPNTEGDACIAMCKRGYFCENGYIRDTSSGACVLPNECPARTSTVKGV